MSLYLVTGAAHAPRCQKSALTSHLIVSGWPEQGITAGSYCFVRPGLGVPGQLVRVRALGVTFISLLLRRTIRGTIFLRGADGLSVRLTKSAYEIEGPVEFVREKLIVVATYKKPTATSRPNAYPAVEVEAMLRWRADARGFHTCPDERRAWVAMFGGRPEDWEGFEWAKFIHPEDRAAYMARWAESVETGRPYLNYGRIELGGGWRYITASADPERDGEGNVVGWEGVMRLEAVGRKSA